MRESESECERVRECVCVHVARNDILKSVYACTSQACITLSGSGICWSVRSISGLSTQRVQYRAICPPAHQLPPPASLHQRGQESEGGGQPVEEVDAAAQRLHCQPSTVYRATYRCMQTCTHTQWPHVI